jgi:prolyl 4-hydroxylase
MKEYELNQEIEKHFILGWYMPENICDEILENFKKQHKENKTSYREKPRDYHSNNLFENYSPKTYKEYLYNLNQIMNFYEGKFTKIDKNYGIFKNINVQYFEPNHNYSIWHSERTSNIDTIFTNLFFITYLNDVHESGETDFYYQKIKIKPRKGLTIVSPSEWTHTHRGNSTKEEKYIVTGRFEYIPKQEKYVVPIEQILRETSTINYN